MAFGCSQGLKETHGCLDEKQTRSFFSFLSDFVPKLPVFRHPSSLPFCRVNTDNGDGSAAENGPKQGRAVIRLCTTAENQTLARNDFNNGVKEWRNGPECLQLLTFPEVLRGCVIARGRSGRFSDVAAQ